MTDRAMRVAVTLARPFMLSPQRSARTTIYLATSPQVARATGGYCVKSQLHEPSPAARDEAAARRLWQLSEELTGLNSGAPRDMKDARTRTSIHPSRLVAGDTFGG